MPKNQNIYKGFIKNQSDFDLMFTAWANNHNGKSKAKKFNKKQAKRRERNEWKKEIDTSLS